MDIKNRTTAQSLYLLTIVGTVLCFFPISWLPIVGVVFLLTVNIASLFYSFTTRDSAFKAHCSYINWTYLWGVLISLAGSFIFSSIMLSNGDFSPVIDLKNSIENGAYPSEGQIIAMNDRFLELNASLIPTAAVIGFAPFLSYMIYRCVKGIGRLKSELLAE